MQTAGTTSWSPTSAPAIPRPSTTTLWDPSTWPAEGPGRRHHGGPARRARPLDRHRGRQDRQLPGRRALAPGTPAPAIRRTSRRLRGGAGRQPPAGDPSSPSRSCAPSTASTPASPARCTAKSRCRSRSADRPFGLSHGAGRAGEGAARFPLRTGWLSGQQRVCDRPAPPPATGSPPPGRSSPLRMIRVSRRNDRPFGRHGANAAPNCAETTAWPPSHPSGEHPLG
jgi:hypothetical protein